MPFWIIASYIDVPTKAKTAYTDNAHQIYNNKIDAKVSYTRTVKHFQVTNLWVTCSIHLTEHYDHKLVISKDTETITKVKNTKSRGDKSDKGLQNRIWHAYYQISISVLLTTGEEPIVKIYTKSANEADKGYRKFIERKWLNALRNSTLLLLSSFIVVCAFNFIQCNICRKLKTIKTNKASKFLFWLLVAIMVYSFIATVTGILNQ